jgi:hypothetical protein
MPTPAPPMVRTPGRNVRISRACSLPRGLAWALGDPGEGTGSGHSVNAGAHPVGPVHLC